MSVRSPIAIAFALFFVVGCGSSASRPAASPPKATTLPPSATAPGERATDPVPSLDAMAAEHVRAVPLMREAARSSDVATRPVALESQGGDTCFRAAVATSTPVRAWFEDDKHAERGESVATTTNGLVPPRGPACARKGEGLKLVVRPVATTPTTEPVVARAIVWQSKKE